MAANLKELDRSGELCKDDCGASFGSFTTSAVSGEADVEFEKFQSEDAHPAIGQDGSEQDFNLSQGASTNGQGLSHESNGWTQSGRGLSQGNHSLSERGLGEYDVAQDGNSEQTPVLSSTGEPVPLDRSGRLRLHKELLQSLPRNRPLLKPNLFPYYGWATIKLSRPSPESCSRLSKRAANTLSPNFTH